MNNLSHLDRKGVSIMIGYVLLISIAVALSTAVFFYLKLYLPDEKPDCYQDINLVIEGVSPTGNVVNENEVNQNAS